MKRPANVSQEFDPCVAQTRTALKAAHKTGKLTRVAASLLVAASLMWAPVIAAAPNETRVTKVSLLALEDGGAEVLIRSDAVPNYSARIAQGGKRIIVDLRDAKVVGAGEAITDVTGVVGGVLTQTFMAQGTRTTRVLIQLLSNAEYRVVPHSEGLRVILRKAAKTAPMKLAQRPRRLRAQAKEGATRRGLAALHDVRFEHGRHEDRVVLNIGGEARLVVVRKSNTRTLVRLPKTSLAPALQRTLDVGAFGGIVRAISTYEQHGDVVVDVDHVRFAHGTTARYGDTVHFVFSRGAPHSSLTGVARDGLAARQTKRLGSSEPSLSALDLALRGGGEWSSAADEAAAFYPTSSMQARRYNGRRVNLDLKDADVHNVFRIIADVGRVNIVAADNVSGTVTIRMKNVPWDQALDTILQAKKLGMVRRGNIIRVAQMADLNKERELAIARRKSELALAPIETRLIPISYADASDMQARAKELLSPRGSISVDERTNVMIVRDVAGNLNQVEELTRALDTQTPQVLIEARIVEATSRFQRDVGIQWGGDVAFGPGTGNETGLVFPSSVGLAGGASDKQTPTGGLSPIQPRIPNPNFAVNLPATVGTGAGGALGLTLGSIDNTVNLSVRLSAAEATGMLRIVSSPRILTLDNSEARISQGTLIPFSQVSAQGVQTVFQEAKLQLLVVPHVTADGSVSMHVKINRDEPDFNQTSARGDPTILKREAETDLLVRDGHTAVIGGIYSRNTGRNVDQIPVLGDIPILGVLFQRRRSSDTRSELVIFITPRIVNRAESLGG